MRVGKRRTFAFALTTSLSALAGNAFAADKIPTPADALLRNQITGMLDLGRGRTPQAALWFAHSEKPEKVSIYYQKLANAVERNCGAIQDCKKGSPLVRYTLALFDSYAESPAFETWDTARVQDFNARIENDPFLMDAQARWGLAKGQPGHLNVYARLKILRHIMDIHGDVYAADGFPVKGLTLLAKPLKDKTDLAEAEFETLSVATNHASLMKDSFVEWLDTITHECRHGIQFSMIHALDDEQGRAYLNKHALMPTALIYKAALDPLSWDHTTSKQYYTHYRNNPLERDAHDRADGGKVSVLGLRQ